MSAKCDTRNNFALSAVSLIWEELQHLRLCLYLLLLHLLDVSS